MDKKEVVHIILLTVALFSIAYIFFSNAITDVYVTIEDGEPVAIKITEMYSVFQVLCLMLITAVGTYSFVYLCRDRTNGLPIATLRIGLRRPMRWGSWATGAKFSGYRSHTRRISSF